MKNAFRIDARIRQAIAAGLIALVLWVGGLTRPVDQLIWTLQSRISSFEASGDIIFVGSEEDLANPQFPERRIELAAALSHLADTQVQRVYIDVVFDKKSTPAADSALRSAMERLGNRLYLVQSYQTAGNGTVHLHKSLPEIGGELRQVGKSNLITFIGYVWDAPYTMAKHGSALPSLPLSMAGTTASSGDTFPINYGFELSSIPMLDLADFVAPGADTAGLGAADGKTVLIANADLRARSAIDIPGHIGVPASLVQIYAAETLKAGLTAQIPGYVALPFCLLVICLIASPALRTRSRSLHIAVAVGLPVIILCASALGIRLDVASSLAFLLIYSTLVGQANWANRLKLVDSPTGLPTFAALEANRLVASEQPTVLVGKIHRLEDVKRTLPPELHTKYIGSIIERLRLKSGEETFYIGHGHYLAWCVKERDPQVIRDHLEGLRALLATPLAIGDDLVDVSMTFSVDAAHSPNVANRLAAAIAAVDQTSEADNPITTTESKSEEDLRWNISLQARIDAALTNGEIYLVYQPKILLATGDLVGVEALVRWNDPTRGMIAPDLFIRQCETAGRMLQLTRHVLREACLAGVAFERAGHVVPISVNISATMLHDWEIVGLLREVLDETSYDPRRLTLEVTETYRISSLQTAHDILSEISALGPKLSMDDFGVGAASFEALLRLPFSEIKIDRLFVSRIVDNPKARGIVRHALQLGKELRIIVVAEGVEDTATLAVLKDLGCLVAQGFCLGRPVDAKKILLFQDGQDAAISKV